MGKRTPPLPYFVIPAKAGTRSVRKLTHPWVSAFAGMTKGESGRNPSKSARHPAENSFVPTTPITINAIKPIWAPLTFSPKKISPPMMTPTAPRPVQIA